MNFDSEIWGDNCYSFPAQEFINIYSLYKFLYYNGLLPGLIQVSSCKVCPVGGLENKKRLFNLYALKVINNEQTGLSKQCRPRSEPQ